MILRILLVCWYLLLALFLSVTAYYVVFHHVSPLSRDQWHMLDGLFRDGLWRTSIMTVSGHRHILAFLLYKIDLDFFAGRNHFLIAADWCLNAGLIFVLCRQVHVDIADPLLRKLLSGWIVIMLVWLLNIALLGWGFNGINNYMSIVNTVLSVFFLHKAVGEKDTRTQYILTASLLAGLATLSFGNGVLVWPIWFLQLFLWRVGNGYFKWAAVCALIFVGAYLSLPGHEAVGDSLLFSPASMIRFPVELMGGPLYHLLRAWRFLPEAVLLPLSSACGLLLCGTVLILMWRLLRERPVMSRLRTLGLTLICIGSGTTIMLTLTRVDGVLEAATDRFQIWALLVWIGLAVFLCDKSAGVVRRAWMMFFFLFPVMAFPSQLDWGARLAEYRTRVDNALLAYQVYLPVAKDAEKALHWNWENKLPHLFPVLERIRRDQLNIFADGKAAWLGKVLPPTDALRVCDVSVKKQEPIVADELLATVQYPEADKYAVNSLSADATVGMRWQLMIAEPAWDYGLLANGSGVVRGLVQPVSHSHLPRFSGLLNESYNAYAVARVDGDSTQGMSHQMVLIAAGIPVCRYGL